VEEQPLQELLDEEEGRDMKPWEPTLKAQALMSFLAPVWPHAGHSTSGSPPNTSFSKVWSQLSQWNSKIGMKVLHPPHENAS
jgi:hypothetical protein